MIATSWLLRPTVIIFFTLSFIASNMIIPSQGFCLKNLYRSTEPLPEKYKEIQFEEIVKAGKFIDYIEKSGILYYNEELEEYLNGIARKMTPPLYADAEKVKIYIKMTRDPTVNAVSLANGNIYLNIGILARTKNEAQLAFILGHEISHIINRDMVYFSEDYYSKTIATQFLDLALSPATAFFGLYGISQLGFGLIYGVTVTGYRRDQEERSDIESVALMNQNGYALEGAVELLNIFIEEKEKFSKGSEIYFLSSHPENEKRKRDIEKLIKTSYNSVENATRNEDIFLNKMTNLKVENAMLNVMFDRPQHAIDNLIKVENAHPEDEKVYFCLAEAYRVVAKDPDLLKYELSNKAWREIGINSKEKREQQIKEWKEQAKDYYGKALGVNPLYADPYRGMALIYANDEEDEKALDSFRKYLELQPDAKDRRFVNNWIERLKKKSEEKKEKKEE